MNTDDEFLSFSTTSLKNNIGTVIDHATHYPVRITSHGRVKAYLVPPQMFEALLELEKDHRRCTKISHKK